LAEQDAHGQEKMGGGIPCYFCVLIYVFFDISSVWNRPGNHGILSDPFISDKEPERFFLTGPAALLRDHAHRVRGIVRGIPKSDPMLFPESAGTVLSSISSDR